LQEKKVIAICSPLAALPIITILRDKTLDGQTLIFAYNIRRYDTYQNDVSDYIGNGIFWFVVQSHTHTKSIVGGLENAQNIFE
jgi:hypothetical protein